MQWSEQVPKWAQATLGCALVEQRLLWDRDRRFVPSVSELMASFSPCLMHFQFHPALAGIMPGISPPRPICHRHDTRLNISPGSSSPFHPLAWKQQCGGKEAPHSLSTGHPSIPGSPFALGMLLQRIPTRKRTAVCGSLMKGRWWPQDVVWMSREL